jgi:hypothetical protein
VREQNGLRALHVRVAGKHRVGVRLGEVEQRRLRATQGFGRAVYLVAQPEPKRRRDLIVAAAARVQPSARVAHRRGTRRDSMNE